MKETYKIIRKEKKWSNFQKIPCSSNRPAQCWLFDMFNPTQIPVYRKIFSKIGCENIVNQRICLVFFRWLRNHQLNVGLLLDSEFIITRRKYFCQQYIKYLEEGYNMYCLDETFVNGRYLSFLQRSHS